MHILVSIHNRTTSPILIECLRLKGVEQLREEPRPVSGASIYPSYIDSVQVEFLKDGKEIVLSDTTLFPFFATLNPEQFGVCVIQSKTPKEPGEYSVRLTWKPLGKVAIPSDPRSIGSQNKFVKFSMSQFPAAGMDSIELFPRR